MYRLLIVDDEPAIVKGLDKIFSENNQFEFDIYNAYSAKQAIEIVKENRIDILISDINMPGMNGIKMSESILFYWPNCRIIFLTGYNEFDYIYEAIRKPNVSYILKSENDDVIIAAVREAVEKIKQENEQKLIIERAKEQMERMTQLLKKELLEYVLTAKVLEIDDLDTQFRGVGIKLDANSGVYTVISRVDGLQSDAGYNLRTNTVYAIKDMFERAIESLIRFEGFIFEESKIIWFLQPEPSSERFLGDDGRISIEKMVVYLKNSVESVQDLTRELFSLSVSFVFSSSQVRWNEVHTEFDILKKVISKSFIKDKSMIIDLGKADDFFKNESKVSFNISHASRNKLNELERILSEGQESELESLCSDIFEEIGRNMSNSYMKCTEIYYRLLTGFLLYINKYSISDKLNQDVNIQGLIYLGMPEELEKAKKFFIGLGKYICMLNKEEDKRQEFLVISKLEKYIRENAGGDVSLVRLADLVYLNPSYLSRFYKQMTGRNLLDFINEVKLDLAKKLLSDPGMRVSDVALKLGFDSLSYFSLFFKKMTGIRPLEYRSLHVGNDSLD